MLAQYLLLLLSYILFIHALVLKSLCMLFLKIYCFMHAHELRLFLSDVTRQCFPRRPSSAASVADTLRCVVFCTK